MLSSTLRLNVYYLNFIHILLPRFHPKIIGHIVNNKQKNMTIYIHKIIRLVCLSMMMLLYKQHLSSMLSTVYNKSYATMRLSWRKGLLIEKTFCSEVLFLIIGNRPSFTVSSFLLKTVLKPEHKTLNKIMFYNCFKLGTIWRNRNTAEFCPPTLAFENVVLFFRTVGLPNWKLLSWRCLHYNNVNIFLDYIPS